MLLGPSNVARVVAYRLGLRSGRHKVQRLKAPLVHPPFFRAVEGIGATAIPNRSWDNRLWWFGWHSEPLLDGPPDWFANPFSNMVQPDCSLDWWRIPDFSSGDIKGLWEPSRMDWAVAWATTAACGDAAALQRLNLWLDSWVRENTPYKGPNWKCGQEASIRVMHLVTAAWLLGQDQEPESGLINLLRVHLQRISPTLPYAIGQQNNHGTSEAAALFIGGTFLVGHDQRAENWSRKGRQWLEELAKGLIEDDGSFSQYSLTYHRVLLDTYAMAEAWRRHRRLPDFSGQLHFKLGAAVDWLFAMTNSITGDAPNLGANDGARLLQLTASNYRDFRPSVQLAAALFKEQDAFGPGPWNSPLSWLGVKGGKSVVALASQSFDKGGYHVLRRGPVMAVMRYPRFRFRPSQADALHLDLWQKGVNLLRDAGSYSYNSDSSEWYCSTRAHNTIEFDGRDQMPRLGRFLFGGWLRADCVKLARDDGETASAGAAYTDAHGARHSRMITLGEKVLICQDSISGSFNEACLRWRLAPGAWYVEGNCVRNGEYSVEIEIEIDGISVTPVLGITLESRYYQHNDEIPEISVLVTKPATLQTRVSF